MSQFSEKRGNTTWAQCAGCQGWLPVSAALLAAKTVALHCPHCQKSFLPEQAQQVVRPG
jgi:hypothetical protein